MIIELLTSVGIPELAAKFIFAGAVGFLAINFIAVYAGVVSVIERKVAAKMQSRVGPNRVGPGGWLQWLADGIKLMLKEDIHPHGADHFLFNMAPFLIVCGVAGAFAVLPWGPAHAIAADLNVGILYFISITSLVVVGILMAGWSSNNKWALIGGMRAAAQIVSYEIPVAMGLLPAIMIVGSLQVSALTESQGFMPWDWTAFDNPFALLGFLVFLTGSVAESNRAPFDLPEAESELVAGFFTEYSGFRFACFTLGEFAATWAIGAITTAVYLGGGQLPPSMAGMIPLSIGLFVLKTMSVVFLLMWFRWTLPRFRIDQMMDFSWKYLLPLSLVAFFGQAIYILISWDSPAMQTIVSHLLALAVLGVIFLFAGRVAYNIKIQLIPINTLSTEIGPLERAGKIAPPPAVVEEVETAEEGA